MSQSETRRASGFLQPITSRPHLMTGIVVGVAVYFISRLYLHHATTRALIGWDTGVVVFVTWSFIWMMGISQETMKRRAIDHDEGRHLVLALAVFAAVASIAALVAELSTSKGQPGAHLRVSLAAGTVVLSWLFVQVIFAIHYAHVYYLAEETSETHRGGLEFNCEEDEPDYWDFFHFSVVIGATSQTADVVFRSKEMRRVSTVHTLLAFAFNTAILATMINLAANLF
jgi:uncharacterized membrane protein